MDFLRPASWEEALAAKAEYPTAVPIAGGTDVIVEIDFDHRRPDHLRDPNRIGELSEWEVSADGRTVRLGPSVPYPRIMRDPQPCSGACDPIDDVRGSAGYRRHALTGT